MFIVEFLVNEISYLPLVPALSDITLFCKLVALPRGCRTCFLGVCVLLHPFELYFFSVVLQSGVEMFLILVHL